MPIVRTYACQDCGHFMDVTLTMKQVNKAPPACPMCAGRTAQEFKPVAIGGSVATRARDLAYDIAEKDYHVRDMKPSTSREGMHDVRYQDLTPGQITNVAGQLRQAVKQQTALPPHTPPSQWGTSPEVLQAAIDAGREQRLAYGSALDALKKEPDLIQISKARAMKVW